MSEINRNIKRILIRSTNWIGDVVMSLPAIENIRLLFPDSEITVLAKPWVIPLYEFHPSIDKIMVYKDDKGFWGYSKSLLSCIKEIRKREFNMAILLQNAFEAGILAFLGGVKIRIGYDTDGRGFLLTHPVKRKKDIVKKHQTEYYLELLKGMRWLVKNSSPKLYISEERRMKAKEFLSKRDFNGFILGVAPGAAYGPAKRWPEEHFAQVSNMAIREWGAKIIIFGSEADSISGKRVEELVKGPCINLCGKTSLGDAMAMIDSCNMMISNDSGLMHVSYALDVLVVAIFGSTDPELTGPSPKSSIIVRSSIDCSPCFKPTCKRDYECLKNITPDEVWNKMRSLKDGL